MRSFSNFSLDVLHVDVQNYFFQLFFSCGLMILQKLWFGDTVVPVYRLGLSCVQNMICADWIVSQSYTVDVIVI